MGEICSLICENCTINPATVKHHISYFPEITTALCMWCHARIHSGNYPELEKKFIHYKKGDANLFYQTNEKIARLSSRIKHGRKRIHHKGIRY